MMQSDLVEFLPWDSEFFGCRIARVRPGPVDAAASGKILEWCAAEAIECLYFLADPMSAEAVAWAEASGFGLLDIRTTLCFDFQVVQPAVPPAAGAARVAPFEPDDLPALRRIARVSHHDSRFYWDPNLRAKSADLFETWIVKSTETFADLVLVARIENAAAGYITLNYAAPNDNGIGLFAIGPDARSRGVGRQLLHCGLEWLRSRGAVESRVVTQGRNRGALRLYQRAGFRVDSLDLWYHLWLHPQVP